MGLLKQLFAGPAALLCVVSSCNVITVDAECEDVCRKLSECGLLPSPLGSSTGDFSADANCQQRCSLTETHVRSDIITCGKEVAIDWCTERNSCRSLASCLEDRVPQQQVTGVTRVTVAALQSASLPAEVCPPPDPAFAVAGASFDEMEAQDWCTNIGASRGRVVIADAAATHVGPDEDCAALLVKSVSFTGIRPGLVEYGLELRGTFMVSTSAPNMPPATTKVSCIYLAGARAKVSTSAIELDVPLSDQPMIINNGGECAGRPASCADGDDNDGDGSGDCEDPECACPGTP